MSTQHARHENAADAAVDGVHESAPARCPPTELCEGCGHDMEGHGADGCTWWLQQDDGSYDNCDCEVAGPEVEPDG